MNQNYLEPWKEIWKNNLFQNSGYKRNLKFWAFLLKRRIHFYVPMQIMKFWGHIYIEFYLNLIVFTLLKKLDLKWNA